MKHVFLHYTDNRDKLITCNTEVLYKYIGKRSHRIFTFLSPKSHLLTVAIIFFIAENISEQSFLH